MAWRDTKDLVAEKPADREVRQVEDYIRRKTKPRFYADENLPTIATEILRRRGADVLTVQEAGRRRHFETRSSLQPASFPETTPTSAIHAGSVSRTPDRPVDTRRLQGRGTLQCIRTASLAGAKEFWTFGRPA
jgi:hypothetical protein